MPVAAALTIADEMKANLSQYGGGRSPPVRRPRPTPTTSSRRTSTSRPTARPTRRSPASTWPPSSPLPTPRPPPRPAGLRQTLFMGTTLRGMLLNAYAFATLGTIAMWAAVAAFSAPRSCSYSGALGFAHAHQGRQRRGPGHGEDPRDCLTPADPLHAGFGTPEPRSAPADRGFAVSDLEELSEAYGVGAVCRLLGGVALELEHARSDRRARWLMSM